MGDKFYKVYEGNMKIIADNFQKITAYFKSISERIESLEARLMKLEKSTGAPHFGQMQDDGETES